MTAKNLCRMLIPLALAAALVGPAASSADAASDGATRTTARAPIPIPQFSRALPRLTRIWTFARRELSQPAIRDAYAQYRVLKRYYDRLTWRSRAQRYCTMVYEFFDSVAWWRYWARYDPAVREAYDYCNYWF